jgi:hypothetical protein
MTPSVPGDARPDPLATLEALTLPELEEAAGEIQRRMGVALRRIGERGADRPDGDGVSPRRRVAELVAGTEHAAFALGAILAETDAGAPAAARHPALAAAIAYAAPSLSALLGRLEQDRRLLTSLGRQLESRLDTPAPQIEGRTVRHTLIEALIAEPSRCAQALEREASLRET